MLTFYILSVVWNHYISVVWDHERVLCGIMIRVAAKFTDNLMSYSAGWWQHQDVGSKVCCRCGNVMSHSVLVTTAVLGG